MRTLKLAVLVVVAGGDTFIIFVTRDKSGKLSSETIHQFGSATLDESSRHYAVQSPSFVAMKTKPVQFTQEQLAGHSEADYQPGQRRGVVNASRCSC